MNETIGSVRSIFIRLQSSDQNVYYRPIRRCRRQTLATRCRYHVRLDWYDKIRASVVWRRPGGHHSSLHQVYLLVATTGCCCCRLFVLFCGVYVEQHLNVTNSQCIVQQKFMSTRSWPPMPSVGGHWRSYTCIGYCVQYHWVGLVDCNKWLDKLYLHFAEDDVDFIVIIFF